jgi:hypothetical protein
MPGRFAGTCEDDCQLYDLPVARPHDSLSPPSGSEGWHSCHPSAAAGVPPLQLEMVMPAG